MKSERYRAVRFFKQLRTKGKQLGIVEHYLKLTQYGHRLIHEKNSRPFDPENEFELIACLTYEILSQSAESTEDKLDMIVSLILCGSVRTAILREYLETKEGST